LLQKLARNGRLIFWKNSQFSGLFRGAHITESPGELVAAVNALAQPDILLSPATKNVRVRHVIKADDHYYLLFNEETGEVKTRITLSANGLFEWLDPKTGGKATSASPGDTVSFGPHELKLLKVITK